MSDNFLRVLPATPEYRPKRGQARRVVAALKRMAPDARTIDLIDTGEITFVDCGANFEAVRCPGCGSDLALDWWGDAMTVAYETGFSDLGITTPCCTLAVSLNDLAYDWPQGFASWWVEARNPGRGELSDDEVRSLADALGHAIRIVWTHV